MRILIIGAGVIGSLFAGKLRKAGYDVTLLARNKRLKELKENGLILRHALSGETEISFPPLIEELREDDIYDYILVTVQFQQVDSLLPLLKNNKSSNIVFVVNNPDGYEKYFQILSAERVLIGFPSAGGERSAQKGTVVYFIAKGAMKIFQSTSFGEPSGKKTKRVKELLYAFKRAGFSPSFSPRMDYWQICHLAVVVPIAKALYRFDSDNYRLAKSYQTLKLMILATREFFRALKKQGIQVTPFKLHLYFLPSFLLVPIFKTVMKSKIGEFAMARHTVVAKEEMTLLEAALRKRINESGIKTSSFDKL